MDVNNDIYGLEKSGFVENSYQVTDSQAIPVYADVQTYPCSICGRCFNVESLRKHQPICRKASQKPVRKMFDAGKQRAADSDVPYAATKDTSKFYKDGILIKPDQQRKRMNGWREGHDQLVRAIREARKTTQALQSGIPLPKPIPSQVPSDYIQCEYCQRNFNKFAAERHIPFCEVQFKRKQLQNTSTTNQLRTNPANIQKQVTVNKKQHEINSAPSSQLPRPIPKTMNADKDYRKQQPKQSLLKRNTINDTSRNIVNGTPPKPNGHQLVKTRSAAGSYLPDTIRPARIIENVELNETYPAEREQKQNNNGLFANSDHRPHKTKPTTLAKHCYECGEAFHVERAKFCCICGEKRFGIQ